ncbi:MAG: molecular chaperone TorD family protein [Deltaproteobacteria bacterium]|nr:molecular chaperone TorD family protein [Deltaproteobacteria bacterium]
MTGPLVRAEGYRLLALAFRYPDGARLRAALAADPTAPAPIAPIAERLRPLVDAALEPEHCRLFAQSVAVSPYETTYVGADKEARLGRLATLYRAFGVRAGAAERERVDHVGAELEFASLLCLKEALAADEGNEEGLAVTREARTILAEEHLGRWARALGRRLREQSRHPFYRALGDLLSDWVEADLAEHGWRPLGIAPIEEDPSPFVCPET